MLFPLLLALCGCKEFQEVQVAGVDGFSVSKLSLEGIEGDVRLRIRNPNDIGFSIYPSEFDVTYSGIHLGKARLSKRVHISANTEKTYTFHLKSSFSGLDLMDLTRLLNGNNLGMIELNGDLKAGKFYLKKRYPVHYKEKTGLLK